MTLAILSLVIGVANLISPVFDVAPEVLSAFGLCFGADAFFKENRGRKRKAVKMIALIGFVINGLAILGFTLGKNRGKFYF